MQLRQLEDMGKLLVGRTVCSVLRHNVVVQYVTTQVSLDIGELEEVIRAYHRLLDIKSKHLDSEVRKGTVALTRGDHDGSMVSPRSYSICATL